MIIDQFNKAGEDAVIVIDRVASGHKSQTFNLAEMKAFKFTKPANPGEQGVSKPAIDQYYALRFTFIDAGTRGRYSYYRVISDLAPYILPIDDPNVGVTASGNTKLDYPDMFKQPKRMILEDQRSMYRDYPEKEYQSGPTQQSQ